MKKLVPFACALGLIAMSAMLTGCGGAKSGVFTGASTGMQGPVTVEMTVEKGRITDVKITESHETPAVATVAMERIPQDIVKYQTTSVDVVTGATLASRAIMNASSKAAESAGFNMKKLAAKAHKAVAGKDETLDSDVVVVGGGGAGLSAAISAAQQGVKVILIEKSSFLGGNTVVAGGAFNAVDPIAQSENVLSMAQKRTLDSYLALSASDKDLHFDKFPEWKQVLFDLQTSIRSFYANNAGKKAGVDMPGYDSIPLHMWHIYTGGLRKMDDGTWIASDIKLARTLAENALDSYDWTGTLGIKSASHKGAGKTLGTVLGAMWPRTHVYSNGIPLITTLQKAAEKAGVQIYTETAGKSLIKDASGKISGINAQKADGTKVTINAKKGVVLACGGYCANPAMVKKYDKYWGKDLSDTTLTTNVGTNTGDGINMAMEVGAATVDLGVAQMMPSSSPIKGTMTDGCWGDASEQIWIDGKGNRFVNEYAERDVLAKASLRLENGIFYIIYAGSSVRGSGAKTVKGVKIDENQFGTKIQEKVVNGHVFYGSTLKELAEASKQMAGGAAPAFTEEQLRKTIEKYNSYVANQNDPDFGKEVLAGAIDLDYIESHPDVGIVISPRRSSLHHTMGGVKINTNAEVLDTNGKVIKGLWAAGEVTGGVHAGNRLGGNAIADIFTFGRIAGKNAGLSK